MRMQLISISNITNEESGMFHINQTLVSGIVFIYMWPDICLLVIQMKGMTCA